MIDNSINKQGHGKSLALEIGYFFYLFTLLPFYLSIVLLFTGDFVPVLALMDAQHPCPKGDDQYQRDVHIASMIDGLTF